MTTVSNSTSLTIKPAATSTKKTWLQHLGSALHTFLVGANDVIKEGDKIAVDAEPIVSFALPGIGTLFSGVANAVALAEAAGTNAAGDSTGNGQQKAAAVVSAVEPIVLQWLASQGIAQATEAQVQTGINLVVAFLNNWDAPTTKPTTTSVSSIV